MTIKKKKLACCVLQWLKQNVALIANIVTVITLGFLILQLKDTNRQTKLLENQVLVSSLMSVSQLGDRCMWNTPQGGDYNSYFSLKKLEYEIDSETVKKAISSQLRRVYDMYKTEVRDYYISKQFAICKLGSACREIEPEQGYSAKNVINHLARYMWIERAKAAYLLRNITPRQLSDDKLKWEDIFKPLINLISDTEWSLAVRKTALDTYAILTGFEPLKEDIFDFAGALEHWDKFGPEILNKKNELLVISSENKKDGSI
jgi:spore germination protein GerM